MVLISWLWPLFIYVNLTFSLSGFITWSTSSSINCMVYSRRNGELKSDSWLNLNSLDIFALHVIDMWKRCGFDEKAGLWSRVRFEWTGFYNVSSTQSYWRNRSEAIVKTAAKLLHSESEPEQTHLYTYTHIYTNEINIYLSLFVFYSAFNLRRKTKRS